MAKAVEARKKSRRKVGNPTEEQIRSAMGKAIREIKRDAKLRGIKLAVAGKKCVDYSEIAAEMRAWP